MKLEDKDLYHKVCKDREFGSVLGVISVVSMILLMVMVVMLSCKHG